MGKSTIARTSPFTHPLFLNSKHMRVRYWIWFCKGYWFDCWCLRPGSMPASCNPGKESRDVTQSNLEMWHKVFVRSKSCCASSYICWPLLYTEMKDMLQWFCWGSPPLEKTYPKVEGPHATTVKLQQETSMIISWRNSCIVWHVDAGRYIWTFDDCRRSSSNKGWASELLETSVRDRKCADWRRIGVRCSCDLRSHEDGVMLRARRRGERGSGPLACRKCHLALGVTLTAWLV